MNSIIIDGKERFLGCQRTPMSTKIRFRRVSDVVKIIPRDKWVAWQEDEAVKGMIDQDGLGSCVGAGSTQGLMIGRYKAEPNVPYVHLSQAATYSLINGGSDDGANIGDALDALMKVGTCSVATIGELDWKKAYKSNAWREEAKRYRILEALIATSFDELMTLQQLRYPGVLGVAVTDAYEKDANDFLPDISERQASGVNHCICAWGCVQKNGKWYIRSPSSWGDGWYNVPESYFVGEPAGELWGICSQTYPSDSMLSTPKMYSPLSEIG